MATSSLFDLRRGFGGRSAGAAPPPDATGLHATVDPLQVIGQEFEPRLVVDGALGHKPGVAYDLAGGRYSRAR